MATSKSKPSSGSSAARGPYLAGSTSSGRATFKTDARGQGERRKSSDRREQIRLADVRRKPADRRKKTGWTGSDI